MRSIYQNQKDCHQDSLSFTCLQFYKYICLNIPIDICKESKEKKMYTFYTLLANLNDKNYYKRY